MYNEKWIYWYSMYKFRCIWIGCIDWKIMKVLVFAYRNNKVIYNYLKDIRMNKEKMW